MQSKRHHFGPLLLEYKIEKDLLTTLIYIGKQMKQNANEDLAGHLQNQFHYSPKFREWIDGQLQPIFQDYKNKYASNLFEHFAEDKNFPYHDLKKQIPSWEMLQTSCWINFMKSGDYNPPHLHGPCQFSYIIFAEVPEEIFKENKEYVGTSDGPGVIEFSFGTNYPDEFCHRKSFLPKSGTMFIFPSTLIHTVMPFKSDVTRITIAGNFTYAPQKR